MKKYLTKRNVIITVLLLTIILLNIYNIKISGGSLVNFIFILNTLLLILVILFSFKNYKENDDRELNKIKANFLSNISHELKTPLNGIIGMNNLIKNSNISSDQREYSEMISSCSETLLTTINDILDFSKMEQGKLSIEYINFDLRKLINDFYNMNHLTAEIENLTFDCFIDSEASNYFIGDPGRIRQILSNLFSNAVKFTSKGSIELSCKIIDEDETNSRIEFSIKDTGVGISKDKIDKLFKSFSQGDNSKSKEFKGLGLGLTINKQLIKLMNGQFNVESRVGIGTVFSFILDLKREPQLLQPKFKADTKSAKCLLVRSQSVNMEKVSQDFSQANIENKLIDSDKEAMQLILDEKYNLVLFDINWDIETKISLKNFTEYIKKNSKASLIGLTSEGKRGDGELCRSLGISGYLVEPFKTKTLFETISIILANNKQELVTIHSLLENRKSNVKILIIDDNNINLIIVKKLLSKMGFHSEVALGGLEGIRLLKESKFDLVFMDIQMPGMNGLQATSAIRNEEAGHDNRNIPIIALTANTTQEDRLNCSQVGMDDFLTKPYQPKLLGECINRFVKWNVL